MKIVSGKSDTEYIPKYFYAVSCCLSKSLIFCCKSHKISAAHQDQPCAPSSRPNCLHFQELEDESPGSMVKSTWMLVLCLLHLPFFVRNIWKKYWSTHPCFSVPEYKLSHIAERDFKTITLQTDMLEVFFSQTFPKLLEFVVENLRWRSCQQPTRLFCQRRRVFSFVLPGDSNCQKITELEDKNVVDKRAKKKVQVKIRIKSGWNGLKKVKLNIIPIFPFWACSL